MRFARSITISALLVVSSVKANDTAVTLGAGGLIPIESSAIVMESEDLRISIGQITVKYLFRNVTSRDVDVTVAFPLPEISGGQVANVPINIPSRDPLNFIDFTVLAAAKRIEAKVEVRAFFDNVEITNNLRALNLPLSPLDKSVTAAVNKLSAPDLARLKKSEWVDCSLTQDGTCWPYWQSRIQFYWTQHFPAGGSVAIEHTYRPVVGGSVMYRSEGGSKVRSGYCPSADSIRQIRHSTEGTYAGDKPVLAEKQIDYILTTANNWSGPIRNFHLSITSDGQDDIVLTCMPFLKRMAPNRYELTASNFRPGRELQLMILQPIK